MSSCVFSVFKSNCVYFFFFSPLLQLLLTTSDLQVKEREKRRLYSFFSDSCNGDYGGVGGEETAAAGNGFIKSPLGAFKAGFLFHLTLMFVLSAHVSLSSLA